MGAVIMDGVTVEDEVIIAAGALVTPGKTLQSGHVYAGSPARQVREISDKERRFFSYSAGNYVRLKDKHLAEGWEN
jgi:carbonic anhydrase/acetyltransferase-like protein (isoleucine patch superfamily)